MNLAEDVMCVWKEMSKSNPDVFNDISAQPLEQLEYCLDCSGTEYNCNLYISKKEEESKMYYRGVD